MITLNQLKHTLVNWFKSHGQINDVYYLTDFDFNSERHIKYRGVNITYQESNLQGDFINHLYTVVIADLVEFDNPEMQDEIHSDSLQIAEDFFAWLQTQYDFDFTITSSVQPFIDDTADRAVGVSFTIELAVARDNNVCQIPSDN